jgi:predicted nucleic acid-binding protein
MPALYVDTSALVKRYVGEVGTRWVRRALAHPVQHGIYTALLAQTEVLSALQRKVREGTLAAPEARRLARRVQRHCAHRYRLVAITPARVTQANALVQAHPLRAYDALHLACALAVRDALQPYGLPAPLFVTADDALLAAARAEGFAVANPLQHP